MRPYPAAVAGDSKTSAGRKMLETYFPARIIADYRCCRPDLGSVPRKVDISAYLHNEEQP